jgi:hypothetical protein|tara:strand:- start:911 stop:1087 length:177 start_codon:yes stop_codon:yes gene_type:complete
MKKTVYSNSSSSFSSSGSYRHNKNNPEKVKQGRSSKKTKNRTRGIVRSSTLDGGGKKK